MRRLVLVCLLMLLPLQWSVAATGGYPHTEIESSEGPWPLGEMVLSASDASAGAVTFGAAPSMADTEHACSSDCHVDDPLWIGALPAGVPPQHAASPHFEYAAPTDSHIPAGPERPDRQPAA